jgi:hypothetical protein
MLLEISFSRNEIYYFPCLEASIYFDTVKSVIAFKAESQINLLFQRVVIETRASNCVYGLDMFSVDIIHSIYMKTQSRVAHDMPGTTT